MQYRAHRYPAHFPVLVRAPIGKETAHVLDVNNTGARIGGLRRLRRGDKIQLDVLSHWIEATVRWSFNDQAGIVFRPQITDHQVDTLRHRCSGYKSPRRRTISFGLVEMS